MTRPQPSHDHRTLIGRRALLVGGAVVLVTGCSKDKADTSTGSKSSAPATTSGSATGSTAGSTTGSTSGGPTTAAPFTAPQACQLSPELTAGPYYLDGPLVRRDITEGRPGAPLRFGVRVLDVDGCRPISGAAVDIWHCDAGGEYSGFNGNSLSATQQLGTNDKRFLRGVQVTDDAGLATFATIFPGWYEGRSIHIHLRVIEGGAPALTYDGGHVAHVGQAFFSEADTQRILANDPYRSHVGQRTTNDGDSIFAQGGPNLIVNLTGEGAGAYAGEFTCTIDPKATPAAAPLF